MSESAPKHTYGWEIKARDIALSTALSFLPYTETEVPMSDVAEVVEQIPAEQRDAIKTREVSDLIQEIQQEYPELSHSFRAFFEHVEYNRDPRIMEILRRGTLDELKEDEPKEVGLFHSMDTPLRRNFLNPHESIIPFQSSMWEEKCERVQQGARHETQYRVCMMARRNTSPEALESEGRDAADFFEAMAVGLESARNIYPQRPLTQEIARSLTVATLLSISTQELMPEAENPMWRITFYRALLDAGFEPNRIPAIHDSIVSFGIFQLTQLAYEGGWNSVDTLPSVESRVGGSIGYLLDDASLPPRHHECVTMDNQILAGTLLQFENIYTYIARQLDDNPILKERWERLDEQDKIITLATFLGATHHNPSRTTDALEQIAVHLTEQPTTTESFREIFLTELLVRPEDETDALYDARLETHEHALNTSTLVTFWQDYLATE